MQKINSYFTVWFITDKEKEKGNNKRYWHIEGN